MATYVTLIKFAGKGAKIIKDACKGAADFNANAKTLEIEANELYWRTGASDGLIISEAPADETATAGMHSLSSQEP